MSDFSSPEVRQEDRMVDDILKDPDLPPFDDRPPDPPAPLGRAIIMILIATAVSLGICCLLGEEELPDESGTVKGRTTPLVSEWTGRVERFLVEPGDSVEAGDVIAILKDEHLLREIRRADREVREIQKALQEMERAADEELSHRLKALDAEIVKLRTSSRSQENTEVQDRLIALREQRLKTAHLVRETFGISRIREELIRSTAYRNSLQARPDRISLPAPVSGTIGRLLRMPGERITQGTPILEMADEDQPYLVVEMPLETAKHFALGDAIPLKFPGRGKTDGRVRNMEELTNPPGSADADNDPQVRVEIEPRYEFWPDVPLRSKVKVQTSDSNALSRRVH